MSNFGQVSKTADQNVPEQGAFTDDGSIGLKDLVDQGIPEQISFTDDRFLGLEELLQHNFEAEIPVLSQQRYTDIPASSQQNHHDPTWTPLRY